MIRIRGRNGFFTFRSFSVWVGKVGREAPIGLSESAETPEPIEAHAEIFSNSPHTQHAPVRFVGPPREVSRLLRRIAAEIEAGNRANVGANVKTKKRGKHGTSESRSAGAAGKA